MFTLVVLTNVFRAACINICDLNMDNIGDLIYCLISTFPIIYLGSCLLINTFKIYCMGDKKVSFFDNFSLKGLTIGGFF